jgi:predicted  nucleic acid-binding Zn-ribbon protein
MWVVVIALLVASAVLGVAYLRIRTKADELQGLLDEIAVERDQTRSRLDAATAETAAVRAERDDAVDRVQRARRDAAGVANRLSEQTSAREVAELAAREAGDERDRLRAELADARSELDDARQELAEAAEASADSRNEVAQARTALDEARADLTEARVDATGARAERDDALARLASAEAAAAERSPAAAPAPVAAVAAADVLWGLALDRIDRTWRTSIALHAEETSPLTGADDPLRAAAQIQVDAAREEAGAAIELRWSGRADVAPAEALVVLSLIESVVAAVSKVAVDTTISVTAAPAAVEVEVDALDDAGRPVVVDVPAALTVGPGRYRVAGDGSA